MSTPDIHQIISILRSLKAEKINIKNSLHTSRHYAEINAQIDALDEAIKIISNTPYTQLNLFNK